MECVGVHHYCHETTVQVSSAGIEWQNLGYLIASAAQESNGTCLMALQQLSAVVASTFTRILSLPRPAGSSSAVPAIIAHELNATMQNMATGLAHLASIQISDIQPAIACMASQVVAMMTHHVAWCMRSYSAAGTAVPGFQLRPIVFLLAHLYADQQSFRTLLYDPAASSTTTSSFLVADSRQQSSVAAAADTPDTAALAAVFPGVAAALKSVLDAVCSYPARAQGDLVCYPPGNRRKRILTAKNMFAG